MVKETVPTGGLICILPMAILFFVTQRYLIRGMTAGVVEG